MPKCPSGLHAVLGGLNIPKCDPVDHRCVRRADPITIFPGGFTIDPLPLSLALNISVLDSSAPSVTVPPTPGLNAATATPSSGFLTWQAVSGFGNFGAGSQAGGIQAHAALARARASTLARYSC